MKLETFKELYKSSIGYAIHGERPSVMADYLTYLWGIGVVDSDTCYALSQQLRGAA